MLLLVACTPREGDDPRPTEVEETAAAHDTVDSGATASWVARVRVLLDGEPAADTLVVQGGNPARWATDADGFATVEVDATVDGDLYLIAAHDEARTEGVGVSSPGDTGLVVELERFDPSDNEAYVFADPGPPDWLQTTSENCGHCHVDQYAEWYASPHRGAASNPVVHDVYGGTASALADAVACAAAGGTWGTAREPGSGDEVSRCLVGEAVADATAGFGACADCHAPGIDGVLGGRDLLEATGVAYDAGVHCDVCHHVSSVDLEAEPGVAGRLGIVRPSEEGLPGLGDWLPLTFGPFPDVPNPRMGAVYREDFGGADLCAGCHEQAQPVLVTDGAVDLARWPDGRLPIHTTWSEWSESAYNPGAPCGSCHTPPSPDEVSSMSIPEGEEVEYGVASGWPRAPGSIHQHSWIGPRQRDSGMLELAAALDVEAETDGGELVAHVTVTNVGPGHALPTGEPLRNVLVLVSATCDGVPLDTTGGDVLPDYAGAYDERASGEDWSIWPGAQVGQVIRVVRRAGGQVDYTGYGPFGDGTFAASEKGLAEESFAGEATIVAVDGDRVTLDRALAEGEVAYRVSGVALPADGEPAAARAGAPGFAFARVLVGADGARMVPHHLAVDVASDNRLLPGAAWTSEHRFAATCDDPEVEAVLVHRAWPWALATQRGWTLVESVMARASL